MGKDVEFLCKTDGNADPTGKPKVYFTCHPDDFDLSFVKISSDLFTASDCAVYYTQDMSADLSSENNKTDLERMNLFVIPVTLKLLTQSTRAMDSDFRFAKQKHIPVLPILMESNLDTVYSRSDRFGELQYIDSTSRDKTEIGYKTKLETYLDSVLIDSKTTTEIRNEFKSYMFLSYRKKDRAYANKLMKVIHDIPEFRDIAIWFDEFLTPGESYRSNIDKMMKKSEFFALIVTPNLLELRDSNPNFVMGVEYPMAKELNKIIVPIEMQATDREDLSKCYNDLNTVIDFNNTQQFRKKLALIVQTAGKASDNNSAKHKYYIARAYLEGVDVEVNVEKGLSLLEEAANDNGLMALEFLRYMYIKGYKVPIDLQKQLFWAKKHTDLSIERYGKSEPYTLRSMRRLAESYRWAGVYQKAYETSKELYELQFKMYGEEHEDTLRTLQELGLAAGFCGYHYKKTEYIKKVYDIECRKYGKTSDKAVTTLHNLGTAYWDMGKYAQALEAYKESYIWFCKIYGEHSQPALLSLNNQAQCYSCLGEHQNAAEMDEINYINRCKALGEEHPDTIHTLNNLACDYMSCKQYDKALKTAKKAYLLKCKVFGEEHPYTMDTLSVLAKAYAKTGNVSEAAKLAMREYKTFAKNMGSHHPRTLDALRKTINYYDDENKIIIYKELIAKEFKALKQTNDTNSFLVDRLNLGILYVKLKYYREAKECLEGIYFAGFPKDIQLDIAENLKTVYKNLSDKGKYMSVQSDIFQLRCDKAVKKVLKDYYNK